MKANSFRFLLGPSLDLLGSFGDQSPLGGEGFLFLVYFVGLDGSIFKLNDQDKPFISLGASGRYSQR